MPFKDGEFDYVYSSHALEDIADTAATLSEWTRILKIKGNLILQVPNPDHYKGFNADHKHDGWRPVELAGLVDLAGCQVMDSYADVGDDRYSTVVVAQRRLRSD
jgi:SAM-dependent methyltransferase